MSWRRYAHLATVGASLLILVVLVRGLDPGRVLRVLARATWGWIIAAAIINLLNTVVESARWTVLASSMKPGIRIVAAFRALIAGSLGNVVLPMKLGDGVRAFVFGESEGLPFASAVSTVVLDRMLDLSMFLAVVALTALVYPLPPSVLRIARYTFIGLGIGFVIFLAMLRAERRRNGEGAPTAGSRAAARFSRFASGLSALRRGGLLVPACALALLSWATRLLVVWTALRAFHLALPLADAAAVLVIVNVGIAVVAVPGNVGPFEVAAVGALKLLSVPEEVALSSAVALHAAEIVPPVLLGLGLLWSGRLDLGRATRTGTGEPEDGKLGDGQSLE
jgi:glycosyltransferase 2 family protein